MKDKNKFTLKIVLVIALAVALIATLISCCVLATKGKLSTQASCDNNQTAFANERPDLDCYATASSLETDYIPITQAVVGTTYYGILVPDDNTNKTSTISDYPSAKTLLNFHTLDTNLDLICFSSKATSSSLRTIYLTASINDTRYIYMYLLSCTRFSNEFCYDNGFVFDTINPDVSKLNILVRTVPYSSNVDIIDLQNQIATLTSEKNALQVQVDNLTAEKADLQHQISVKQERIDTLTAEKKTLEDRVQSLIYDKTDLQNQLMEKQNQIDTLTAEKATLQAQLNEKQNQIDTLTIQKNALQTQVNDLTAKNTDLQNRLDKLLKDTYFCTYETVVQDIYMDAQMQPHIDWRRSSNGVISSEPFGNGQEGREHNSFYLDGKAIMGVDNRPNISFYNTFYLYEKNPSSGHFQTVSFNGVIDFVSYSILHYDSNKGYPIICTQDSGDFNIAFRLKTYNADAMKDVVVHDRTYKTGYDRGHANGISEATQSGHIFESSTSFLKSIFTDLGQLLDIKVFGNITVGTLIGIPLILLVVMAVLKLVRG